MGEAHRIAERGKEREVRAYFHRNPDKLDERDEGGQTPLLRALEARREDTAALLLELGASPDRTDRHGATPLMAAARLGLVSSARLLVSLGVDVRAEDSVDGLTALEWASSREHHQIIELLRKRLAELNGV
jgi:cytohesin